MCIIEFLFKLKSKNEKLQITILDVTGSEPKSSMLCYSEVKGEKFQICDPGIGFKTCFTKYNESK